MVNYNKFIVAILWAAVNLLKDQYDIDIGIEKETLRQLVDLAVNMIFPLLVMAVPNGRAFWKWRS